MCLASPKHLCYEKKIDSLTCQLSNSFNFACCSFPSKKYFLVIYYHRTIERLTWNYVDTWIIMWTESTILLLAWDDWAAHHYCSANIVHSFFPISNNHIIESVSVYDSMIFTLHRVEFMNGVVRLCVAKNPKLHSETKCQISRQYLLNNQYYN